MELSVSTFDSLGRPLQEGDEVLLVVTAPTRFRIVEITPVVDPRAPQNMLKLTFRADAIFIAARGLKNPEFLLVRTVQEVTSARGEAPPPPPARDQES